MPAAEPDDHMKIPFAITLLLIAVDIAFADELPRSYADAKVIWENNHKTGVYQKYAEDFAQFNNHFRLDEKDGCYAIAPGPVNLMLVIAYQEKSKFATIDPVFADVDTAKGRCFQKSYRGIPTKIPPFTPFVLHLSFR